MSDPVWLTRGLVADIVCSKRRRNTEASARFRAKKKEREQVTDTRASGSRFTFQYSQF